MPISYMGLYGHNMEKQMTTIESLYFTFSLTFLNSRKQIYLRI